MPDILFASNNLSHWPLSVKSVISKTFDGNRVPYSLAVGSDQSINSPTFTPTTGEVTWIHFRYLFDDLYDSESFFLIKAYDINGVLLYQIDKRAFTSPAGQALTILKLKSDGGDVTSNQTFPFNEDIMNQVDIRYENDNDQVLNVKLYVNGALAASASYAGTYTGKFQPAFFSLGCCFEYFNADPNDNYFSEIIVATGDTRNARLELLRPTASGGLTQWVGVATDLGDDDPTTGMTSITADQRQTLQMSAYGGASNISAVAVVTQSMAGENGPQNMRHMLRKTGANYDGPADLPLGATIQYNLTDFKINPSTSLPWVGSDMSGLEMGFVSKT